MKIQIPQGDKKTDKSPAGFEADLSGGLREAS
jgi:hypothetical protein